MMSIRDKDVELIRYLLCSILAELMRLCVIGKKTMNERNGIGGG